MRVLKDNSKKKDEGVRVKPYPRKVICSECKSELEYEESDLYEGEYGCMYVNCPICDYGIMLEDNENNITLTMDNIKFPVHFHHINKDQKNVKDIFNEDEIKKYLREAITYFRNNKDEYVWGGWITANLFIHVHRYSEDEEYNVTVSGDFYNMEIPFEEEDYE